MLTCALREQVKELKKEIINQICIENINCLTFTTMNTQVPRKCFYL